MGERLVSKVESANELVTPRLFMRPLRQDDLADLVGLHSDPQVMLGRNGVADAEAPEETAAWLARSLALRHANGVGMFWIGLRATREFVGRAGIRPARHSNEYELAYAIRREHWARGLGTEAAGALRDHALRSGLTRWSADVLIENVASQRILERLGLLRVGEGRSPDGSLRWFRYLADIHWDSGGARRE